MPAPSITILEQNVGVRPILARKLNKIGLVGHFNWGPVNTPTLVQGLADCHQQFGSVHETGLTGRISCDAIYSQNSLADVYVVRIAPTTVAAVKATKNFNASATPVLTVDAKYPGTEGSNITVQIAAGTAANSFKLIIVSANLGITETWDNLDIRTGINNLAAAGGPNEVGKGSKLIACTKITNGNPDVAAAVALSTGTPGTNGTAQDSDYVGAVAGNGSRSGLYALDPIADVYFVLCAQQSSTTVNTGIQTYVASRNVGAGLVFGIMNTPSGQDPATVSIGSLDTKRAAMFWPWVKSVGVPTAEQVNFVAPDGFIAGLLSSLDPNGSPGNKILESVYDCQYQASEAQSNTMSDKRVNTIRQVRTGGIRCVDGLTLSSDTAWAFIPIRKEYDQIETDAYDAMGWVLEEPNDPVVLWPVVRDQLDGLLDARRRDRTIVNFLPTVIDSTNNPPLDIAAGKLRADLRVQFTYPAKFFTIAIQRELSITA